MGFFNSLLELARGLIHAAIARVERWTTDEALEPEARSAALHLRAEASLLLGDAEAAAGFAEEATALGGLDVGLDLRILAASDPAAALARLDDGADDPWLRAELLIRLGRGADARAVVDRQPIGEGTNEARVRALAYAASGDANGALASLEPILAATSDIELQGVAAVLHYASAQARSVATRITPWPTPTHSGLVRRSTEAIQHLRRAAELFGVAAAALDDAEASANRQVWRLACLVDLPQAEADAQHLADTLLALEPPHPGAVHWALARGLTFDAQAAEQRLQAKADGDPEALAAVATLMRLRDASSEAVRFLSGRLDTIADRDRPFIATWIERLRSEADSNPLAAALAAGRASGDWRALETLAEDTSETAHRLMALQVLAQEGRWAAVLGHRAFLLRLETPESLSLLATALQQTDDPAGALESIDAHLAAFGPSGLPPPLVALRIDCLAAVGRLTEAFGLMDAGLPPDNPAARMLAVRMKLNIGDLESVALDVVRGRLDTLPAEHRLRVAHQIAPVAPAAARALLQGVDLEATDINLAPLAFEAAEIASADASVRQAVSRRLLGGEAQSAGIVKAVTIEEILAMARDAPSHDPANGYSTGDAPLHRQRAAQIGQLYARLLSGEGAAPNVFVRDAAAQAPRPIETTTLRLDALAILTAHALGLMPALYAAFQRVEVSQHLPIALQQLERELVGRQVGTQGGAEDVLALLQDHATVVPTGPITEDGSQEPGTPGAAEVAAGLLELGRLTAPQADALAFDLTQVAGEPIAAGSAIWLTAPVLAQVAQTGLLQPALELWSVSIDTETLAMVRRAADADRAQRTAAAALGGLRRAVVEDLRAGRLAVLPRSESESHNAVLESLRDLRAAGPATIWTEDRAVHLLGSLDQLPVVEAYDVVSHLRLTGHLTSDSLAESLRRLRDAGFRFLPIEADEVLALLRAAPITSGAVVETPALAAIRRAFAADLLQEPVWRLAVDPETPTAETKFALRVLRIFDELIRRVWNLSDGIAEKTAWCDWLLRSMGCERLERAPLAAPSEAGRRSLYVIELASRLSLGSLSGRRREDREAAFEWVWGRLIAPELEADASLSKILPAQFGAFWCEPFLEEDGTPLPDTPRRRRERATLCAAGVACMPEKMRAFLLADPRLSDFLSEHVPRRLSFGELVFPADKVLGAVIALAGKNGQTRRLKDGKRTYQVRATADTVQIRSDGSSIVAALEGDLLDLVAGEPDVRAAAAGRLLAEADASPGLEGEAQRLAALATPYERMAALHEIQNDTVGGKLRDILRLASVGQLTVEAMAPPPPEALRHWWRWPAGTQVDPQQLKQEAAADWVSRVASAPLRSWSIFATAADEDLQPYQQTPPQLLSPLGDLARLAMAAPAGQPDALRDQTEAVIDRFQADGDAFVDLVWLFQHQADRDPRWRAEDPTFASLAMWAWTDLVWRALARSGSAPASIAEFWRGVIGRRPRALVLEARETRASAAPWICAPRLLATGLAVALGASRDAVWTDALTGRLARFVLDDARDRGPQAVGPLASAPDRHVTWLADASPFIWLASGDLAAAVNDSIAAYPHDETKMAALALAGPDVMHPEAAVAMISKLEDLWQGGGRLRSDRWVAELRYLGIVVSGLQRRDALDDATRTRVLALFETMLETLARHPEWMRLREGVYYFVFNQVCALSIAELARFLKRVFDRARSTDRIRLAEVTEAYHAGLPFEERGPLWQAHLVMRAVL
jgi:hypothetical protein